VTVTPNELDGVDEPDGPDRPDGQDGPEVFVVPDALAGQRVDRAVALFTGWSRSEVQAVADRGEITVGGRPVAKSRKLVAGDRVEVQGRPEGAALPGPEPVAVDVVYEDADVVVVVKPAGLVVHPGAGHDHGTLVHGLLARYPEIASVGGPDRPGIVHRLDRDTSGVMVVARSTRAYDELVDALAQRAVTREYEALVWGHPENARGVIDAPIGRSSSRRTRMAVRTEGKDARTVYEVEEWFGHPEVARLLCRLETGRTHQIRVHLAAIGHPVVGDGAYGGRRAGIALDRPFLHAGHLEFAHPVSGAAMEFSAPLPPELEAVLEQLRS
jgi:23S rRNA pseudouridine1911/1915/1917 synthase